MSSSAPSPPAVRVEGVRKTFGATAALAGVDLIVPEGTVFGLLGPNGAGKTTLVRVLATLLAPSAGHAEVFGRDVVSEAAAVRELLGLTGQFAAVDEILSGRENLQMFGRLFDLPPAQARRRAAPRARTPEGCAAGWTSLRACSRVRGSCSSTSRPLGSIRAAATRSGGS